MKKTFVIDTSVLLYHEDAIHAFPECNLIIPMAVLEELDTFKIRMDGVGNASRYVNRFLDKLRSKGSFVDGIQLDNGQIIYVYTEYKKIDGLDSNKNDNKILGTCLKVKDDFGSTSLITRDIALRIKSDSVGIPAEHYSKNKAVTDRKNAYTGVSVHEVEYFEIDDFYKNGYLELECEKEFYENEFVVLKSHNKSSGLGRFYDGRINKLNFLDEEIPSGIKPRNKEQRFAMDVLNDPNISMITIISL